jgi:hypothetical protein
MGQPPVSWLRVGLTLLQTRVDVAVGGSGAERLAGSVSRAWDRCLAAPDAPPADITVEVFLDHDETAVARTRELGTLAASDEQLLMNQLSVHLTLRAIASRHGHLWMLHACSVADTATGAGVVLVAPSGTGKTTAAAVLGRHFGYLTDETAGIRPDGTLVPYPKPLSVLGVGQRLKRQSSPTELGLLEAPGTPWLAAIALLDRRGGGGPPSVERVRTAEALPALAEQTSALQLLERPLHLVAGHLGRSGGLHRITYREAGDLVPLVSDLIGAGG